MSTVKLDLASPQKCSNQKQIFEKKSWKQKFNIQHDHVKAYRQKALHKLLLLYYTSESLQVTSTWQGVLWFNPYRKWLDKYYQYPE